MTRPRGFSLLEMVMIMPIIAVITTLAMMMLPMLLQETPALRRTTQTDRVLGGILLQVQRDIDRAGSLPESAGGKTAGADVLLIQTPQGTVCYQVADGQIERCVLGDKAAPQVWQTPGAVVAFNRSPGTQPAQALEVSTAIRTQIGNQLANRLVKNHLYYLNALPASQARK
jgi:type II secretory pathway component PulJ